MSLRARIAAPEGAGEERGDSHLVAVYRAKLLEEIDLAEMSSLAAAQRRTRLERVLGHIISREGPVLSTAERGHLIRRVVDEALGLGVLEPLLEDASITEIMVNGPDQIFVERAGRVELVPARFASEEQLMQTIERIVSTVNRRVDESNPMVDARLPSGERVNVIIPPLALDGATLTIRRFPRAYTLSELIDMGTLDEQMTLLLGALVRAKFNVVVSGPTGAGKTTLLNALSGLIPDGERIITVEDAAELQLQQTHVIRLESRPPNVEGTGRVTIRDLVRNSLRMRPDRIIVGEVRGGETLDMLQAMSTGHDGSLATVHANSAEDALMRLQTLASMSEVSVPYEALRDQINSAVDCVVQLARDVDGSRRISEIALLDSTGRQEYRIATVSDFQAEPMDADRVVRGRFRYYPLPTGAVDRLRLANEPVPPAFSAAEVPAQLTARHARRDPGTPAVRGDPHVSGAGTGAGAAHPEVTSGVGEGRADWRRTARAENGTGWDEDDFVLPEAAQPADIPTAWRAAGDQRGPARQWGRGTPSTGSGTGAPEDLRGAGRAAATGEDQVTGGDRPAGDLVEDRVTGVSRGERGDPGGAAEAGGGPDARGRGGGR